jgi:hypothetical protein
VCRLTSIFFRSSPEPDAFEALVSTGGCDNCDIHPTRDLLDCAIGINRMNSGNCFAGINIAVIGFLSAISTHGGVIDRSCVFRMYTFPA